jgi:hypothetical protein
LEEFGSPNFNVFSQKDQNEALAQQIVIFFFLFTKKLDFGRKFSFFTRFAIFGLELHV